MTSPAARHMMRVSASETARRAAVPLRNATAYEQMLVKLAADNRTLKQIRSNERKADKSVSCCRSICHGWLASSQTARARRMTSS